MLHSSKIIVFSVKPRAIILVVCGKKSFNDKGTSSNFPLFLKLRTLCLKSFVSPSRLALGPALAALGGFGGALYDNPQLHFVQLFCSVIQSFIYSAYFLVSKSSFFWRIIHCCILSFSSRRFHNKYLIPRKIHSYICRIIFSRMQGNPRQHFVPSCLRMMM